MREKLVLCHDSWRMEPSKAGTFTITNNSMELAWRRRAATWQCAPVQDYRKLLAESLAPVNPVLIQKEFTIWANSSGSTLVRCKKFHGTIRLEQSPWINHGALTGNSWPRFLLRLTGANPEKVYNHKGIHQFNSHMFAPEIKTEHVFKLQAKILIIFKQFLKV